MEWTDVMLPATNRPKQKQRIILHEKDPHVVTNLKQAQIKLRKSIPDIVKSTPAPQQQQQPCAQTRMFVALAAAVRHGSCTDLKPALAAAAVLTWTTTVAELSTSIIVYSGGRETIPIQIFKLIKHFHAAGTAINDFHLGRNNVFRLQFFNDAHSHPLIREQNIADTKNNDSHNGKYLKKNGARVVSRP